MGMSVNASKSRYAREELDRLLSGVFFVADGPDAGGKGSAISAVREWIKDKGIDTFDLIEFQHEHGRTWPDFNDFPARTLSEKDAKNWMTALYAEYKCLKTGEPPYAGGGWDLRQGVLQNISMFSAKETAECFSAYRSPFFGLVIKPWLDLGGMILQERYVSTSMLFQPIQARLRNPPEELSLDYILELPGNKRALKTNPSFFLVMTCNAHEAVQRIAKRLEKQDNCDFEGPTYLPYIVDAYGSGKVQQFFKDRGSYVATIDTSGLQIEDTKRLVVAEWERFLQARRASKNSLDIPASREDLIEESVPPACGD